MCRGETQKASERRERTGWFQQFAPSDRPGIDIGCGLDPLNHTFRRFDVMYGDDGQIMSEVPDDSFFTVYASHVLEHLYNPVLAIRNWHRILGQGGYLIVVVPHRDLYERRNILPSRWNHDHKTFWLPDRSELPDTRSLRETIIEAVPLANIVDLSVAADGWSVASNDSHSCGEYSIEAIIRK